MNESKKKNIAQRMPKFDLVGSLMAHEDGSLDEKGTSYNTTDGKFME